MKITKYVHSCLLIKEDGKSILIDPGNYTADSGLLDINKINSLDYLLITHEHPDHFDLGIVKEAVNKFPNVMIKSNSSVGSILANDGITCSQESDGFIKLEDVKHEKVFGIQPPVNTLFRINDLLTHPGDSISFDLTTKILALPVQAPWESLTQAVEKAMELKPEIIIPIHDWHWRDEARKSFYIRLESYFKDKGVRFISLQNGVSVNL